MVSGKLALVNSVANVTRGGWNIGAGAEFMLAPQRSAKPEYADTQAHQFKAHQFKAGANYQFAG